MHLHNISLGLLSFLILATLIHHSNAQNSPDDFVSAHNISRAQVGVGPIIWDATVAAYALNYANARKGDCSLVHSGGPYGENLAKGTGSFTGTAAVNLWVAEKTYYNYAANTCATGQVCGHYTQVVWKNSVRLGCARVLCSNNVWWYVVCSYDPPGNYVGQWPY